MKDKIEFEGKLIEELKSLGYTVYTEKKMKGSRRRPDLVAIQDDNSLIIETKSLAESQTNAWLSTYKGDYLPECRKACSILASKVGKHVAGWMVVIGGQLQYYIKKIGEWYLPEINLNRYNLLPSLAFHKKAKEDVIKAVKEIGINYSIIDLPKDLSIIKLNKEELLKITW